MCWAEVGDRKLLRQDMVQEMSEKTIVVWKEMKDRQSRQENYTNKHHKDLKFEMCNHVFDGVTRSRCSEVWTKEWKVVAKLHQTV